MKELARRIGLLLSAALLAAPASAATRLGDSCDLAVLGARDDAGFLQFDRALRDALQSQDAAALSRLVQFPPRITWQDGAHTMLADAAALSSRLSAASWALLHKAVGAQPAAQLFCNAQGLMYGNGELWANPDAAARDPAFRISAINLPETAPAAAAQAAPGGAAPGGAALVPAATQFACSTDKFQIVIDTAGAGTPRYRSWDKPHASPDAPAMELVGKVNAEGTGLCLRRSWRFANGNVDYLLDEPGCNDGSVPAKARARLEVRIAGKPQLESWCY